jgi:rhamnogalacturonyl hydrolase YesR
LTPYADWFLSRGVVFSGLMRISEATGNSSYADLVRRAADFTADHFDYFLWEGKAYGTPSGLAEIVKLGNLDSCGAIGSAYADLLLRTNGSRYRPIVMRIANYIEHEQVRRPDGTFGRGNDASQLVVDDLYMACPFLVRAGKITGDRSYYDDAARQLLNFSRYLQDPTTYLYHHGAELDQDYVYPAFWGRGNGWAAMAATEVLSFLPDKHPQRQDVWAVLHNQLRGLLAVQAESGMWRQLLDHPDSYEETSGTAMFAYSLARAVNRGWVTGSEAEEFANAAKRAWAALEQRIQPNGAVTGTCAGAAIRRDLGYYYQLPTPEDDDHGRGAVLIAGAEMVLLLRSEVR